MPATPYTATRRCGARQSPAVLFLALSLLSLLTSAQAKVVTRATSASVPALLTLGQTTYAPGEAAIMGTVELDTASQQDTQVTLSSDTSGVLLEDPTTKQAVSFITVPASSLTADFLIDPSNVTVTVPTTVTISASANGTTQQVTLTLVPTRLTALTLDQSTILGAGNTTVTGTVQIMNAVTTDTVVSLSSDTPSAATVPASVTIPAGRTAATFTFTASAVTTDTTVTITATLYPTRPDLIETQTATLDVLASGLLSVAVSPTSLPGGSNATGTVTLNNPATTATNINLSVSNTGLVGVPPVVTVQAGQTTATFTVNTAPVAVNTNVTISALLNGVLQEATLTIQSPQPIGLTINPTSIAAGLPAAGTVTLNGPAPNGGETVTLSSDTPNAATVPATIVVPSGLSTTTFSVTTLTVATPTTVKITATSGGVSKTASLTVTQATVAAVSLNPSAIVGGNTTIGTVTLTSAAQTGGTNVSLFAQDSHGNSTALATVPSTILVPAGQTGKTFTVSTSPVAASTALSIVATYNGTSTAATLTLTPSTLLSIKLTPATITGSLSGVGAVTLGSPAPAGGAVVTLSSSNTAAAPMPASVTVGAGATTATFTFTTNRVTAAAAATITATLGSVTKTASLTVNPFTGFSYPAGLNMISLPYDYSQILLDTIFGITNTKLETYVPNLPVPTYVVTPSPPANTVVPGRGYFVRFPTAVTVHTIGKPVDPTQNFQIALQVGWNQIGDPFPVSRPTTSLSFLSGSITYPFMTATGSARPLVYGTLWGFTPNGGNMPLGANATLIPGQGYWIYAFQATTMIVPHP